MTRQNVSKVVRTTLSAAVASALLLAAGAASAQGGPKSEDSEDGYGYTFSDDPLTAGGFGPSDSNIKVRPQGVRRTLIRPRISFVPEMLTSVENI